MEKILREGVSTGSCAAAAALASAMWQLTGECPQVVKIETPVGKILYLDILKESYGVCGVKKDAGDDIDVTDGCIVKARVEIKEEKGDILFCAGKGVGRITQPGLKLPVGEPAINPVPREMIRSELRKQIGERKAVVYIEIPNGEELAKKTFNGRLGIVGGLSILGTTGIVRPMSSEAVRESLSLELSMHYAKGNREIVFVLGSSGEKALTERFGPFSCVMQISNDVGYMIERAADMGFETVLIGGFAGKLVKLSAGIMNTHSHIADGRREVLCTQAALAGAERGFIEKLYGTNTVKEAVFLLKEAGYEGIWESVAEEGAKRCRLHTGNRLKAGLILLDDQGEVLGRSGNISEILEKVRLWEK